MKKLLLAGAIALFGLSNAQMTKGRLGNQWEHRYGF